MAEWILAVLSWRKLASGHIDEEEEEEEEKQQKRPTAMREFAGAAAEEEATSRRMRGLERNGEQLSRRPRREELDGRTNCV